MRGGRWQCRCLLVYKMYVVMTWTAERRGLIQENMTTARVEYSLLYMSFLLI